MMYTRQLGCRTYNMPVCMDTLEIAKYLIQHQHAKVDHAKKDSWTALHVASRNNQLDVVQLLLEVGQR